MRKVYIFDIGNVILTFRPAAFLREMGWDTVEADALERIIFRSGEWQALDRGTISVEEAVENFCAREPDREGPIRETIARYHDMFAPIEGTISLLHELKRGGHPLYYLSNFHEAASRHIVAKYPFSSLFAGGIFSWQVKLLKPEAEIYRKLLDDYDLDPQNCVFVDDTAENVAAAEALDIGGIIFTTPEALSAQILHMGDDR